MSKPRKDLRGMNKNINISNKKIDEDGIIFYEIFNKNKRFLGMIEFSKKLGEWFFYPGEISISKWELLDITKIIEEL